MKETGEEGRGMEQGEVVEVDTHRIRGVAGTLPSVTMRTLTLVVVLFSYYFSALFSYYHVPGSL